MRLRLVVAAAAAACAVAPALGIVVYNPLCMAQTNSTEVNWYPNAVYPSDFFACNVTAEDSVQFVWQDLHTVRRVSSFAAFQACDITSGKQLSFTNPYSLSVAAMLGVAYQSGGALYFIDDQSTNCVNGMKVMYTILGTACTGRTSCLATGDQAGNFSNMEGNSYGAGSSWGAGLLATTSLAVATALA